MDAGEEPAGMAGEAIQAFIREGRSEPVDRATWQERSAATLADLVDSQ